MKRITILLCLFAMPIFADAPVVEQAVAFQNGRGIRIDVTLSHGDTGWDHYADGWQVRDADGTPLGHRTLHHPHVHEQPFTRSLTLNGIPQDQETVWIFAKDNLGNWSPEGYELKLP